MNKVFLAGRLAADPKQFITQTGKMVANVDIACPDNMNKNEVYFFPCVAWQANAKFINTYLKKGDAVVVDGRLTRRSYVSKEGKNVYITEIVVDSIKPFGSSRSNSDSQRNYNNQNNDKNFENNNSSFNNSNNNFENNNSSFNNSNNNFENNNSSFSNSNNNFPNVNDVYESMNKQNISQNNINEIPSGVYNNGAHNDDGVNDIVDLDWLDEIDK